ncbi:alpha/beta hydrolase [Sphingomonas desiccabilis]|uniref:Alpha/beta hydrolase n=1 Tax=Sphingomonas desiccabilis TaxID=429134 RepID=A0A4Q2IKU6_9SPHN|nr:alpha/beta hydrolase [Sphingomonas desiccabilis]MBB3912578.1 acetyl esterase [Sphingomonas desiccabilis]RXZ29871.1 alpha/beta hydrolase [Sphingomonas desiccabilis]
MDATTEALAEHDDVDPEIRRFVIALNHGYGQFSDFDALPLPERRAAAETVREQWRTGGPVMAETREATLAGCRARLHYPVAPDAAGSPPLPAMLYIHGGGWTMFSIDTHDRLMREYAARAGIVVAGIDYSLSPEAKYPTALDEVVEALRTLRRDAAAYGVDADALAIGGDSAGANLSVAACLRLRDAGEPLPRAMLLNYGAFDPVETPSYARYDGPAYMLTIPEMNQFWANYVSDAAALNDPYVAPARANLAELPAALLAIAECDILADANRAMASRLEAAGVPVEMHVYSGATHSFLEAVSVSGLANQALDDAARWLADRLTGARA